MKDEGRGTRDEKATPATALTIAIVTVSDRAARGAYEDKSGPAVRELCETIFQGHALTIEERIVPDEPSALREVLKGFIDAKVDYLFTTGGTGIGPRDITPEVTKELLEKELPGISEAARAHSLTITKNAILSRATAGIAGTTLIVNLPGSPKAAREILAFIGLALVHASAMIRGIDTHRT